MHVTIYLEQFFDLKVSLKLSKLWIYGFSLTNLNRLEIEYNLQAFGLIFASLI